MMPPEVHNFGTVTQFGSLWKHPLSAAYNEQVRYRSGKQWPVIYMIVQLTHGADHADALRKQHMSTGCRTTVRPRNLDYASAAT